MGNEGELDNTYNPSEFIEPDDPKSVNSKLQFEQIILRSLDRIGYAYHTGEVEQAKVDILFLIHLLKAYHTPDFSTKYWAIRNKFKLEKNKLYPNNDEDMIKRFELDTEESVALLGLVMELLRVKDWTPSETMVDIIGKIGK